MRSIYYDNGELAHYGIKGMKWGIRRFQNQDGTLTDAGKARERKMARDNNRNYGSKQVADARANYKTAKKAYNKSFNTAYNKSSLHLTKKGRDAEKARWEDVYDKANALKSAKQSYKDAKTSAKKAAVKAYDKKFEKASVASDKADAIWNEAKSQYKNLGKTRVTRFINAVSGKSDAAKQYLKTYENAVKASDLADKQWSEATKKYRSTGRNAVERLVNNIKYGS